MKKEIIHREKSYDIPCINNITGNESLVVVVSHGFGSSMQSSSAANIPDVLAKYGIGSIRFDFPAHGESPVDGGMLRIANCLDDLAAVEEHAREMAPGAEMVYFSSSFGAYINLIYLAIREHAGHKSFLRCAAVDMPGIFKRATRPEHCVQLEAQGFVILDYPRPLKITQGFIDDLETHDVFKLYRPGMAELAMVHGTADEAAPIGDARRFAKLSGASLTVVEGADHRFTNPGGAGQVDAAVIRFFCGGV